jgi:hypothetical protein
VLLVALVALAAAAAGCPLPQPVPEIARTDGGSGSALRIRLETVQPSDPVILVSPSCDGGPRFTLSATVEDGDTTERVEARWFLDYDRVPRPVRQDEAASSSDPNDPARPLPPAGAPAVVLGSQAFPFPPFDPSDRVHVVELVVCSIGFPPIGQDPPGTNHLYRTPLLGEQAAQVYRWVFRYVDDGGRCN